MKVVDELPDPHYKGRQPDEKYSTIANALSEGKIVMLEWDEIGKPGQDIQYKATLIRGALKRRGVTVVTRVLEEGLYLMAKQQED